MAVDVHQRQQVADDGGKAVDLLVDIAEEFLAKLRIHVVLIHHGFHQNLDRRQRRFQLVRCIGNELVARLVEVVHLLAHLVERSGELRHFAFALHVDAVFVVAFAHPLDAAGKLCDRLGHDAGNQPRQHQHRRQRHQEDEPHAVAHGDQRIHRLLHIRQQQQRADAPPVRLQRRN